MTVAAPQPTSAVPETAARPKMRRWLHLLVTLALCALAWSWLLRHADLATLSRQAARLPAWTWVAAAAGLLGGHGMRALRLRQEWRHVRDVPWLQCLRIVLAHNALVLMLPLRSGEAAYVWAVRRCWGVDWRAAALALLRWRLQDVAVLAVLAVALLLPLAAVPRLVLAAVAAVAIANALPPLWSWLLARSGVRASGHASGRGPWGGIVASASNWTLKVLANGGLLAALAGLPVATALRAALGGELAGVQPFQPPAGLGTYEAGVWLAAGVPDMLSSTVVAAALAVHAFSLAVALGSAALAQIAVAPSSMPEATP